MRNIIQRIVVLTLVCLVLGIIAAWSTSTATRLGEEVPNDVAATLRGGACQQYPCQKVYDAQCSQFSVACPMQPVIALDKQSILSYDTNCEVYCGGYPSGGGQLGCQSFPTNFGLPCDG